LDNNHFTTYFQYDDEGKLHRMMKETENGIYTVSERNIHTPPLAQRHTPNEYFPMVKPMGGIKINGEEINNFRGLKLYDYENPESKPENIKGDFEIFELKYNPDEQKMEFFGVEKDKILKIDSIGLYKIRLNDSLGNIPGIKGYKEFKNSVDSLGKNSENQLNKIEKNSKGIENNINSGVKEAQNKSSYEEFVPGLKKNEIMHLDSAKIISVDSLKNLGIEKAKKSNNVINYKVK
jgi:hypothetical protein